MGILTARFRAFDKEAREIDAVIDVIPPRQKTLGIIIDLAPPTQPTVPFIHFVNWVQIRKGGIVERSFTNLGYPSIARTTSKKRMEQDIYYDNLAWHPEQFSWETTKEFNYFLVRSGVERADIFGEAIDKVRLVFHNGHWWPYENRSIPSS